MAVLPLVIAPDERLNQPSAKVETFDDELRRFCADLLETMYANKGIGLAAVQVGVHKRVVVVDTEWGSPRYEGDDEKPAPGNPIILINPEISAATEESSFYNEGCLSFPEQYSEVERPAGIEVKYQTPKGESKKLQATGLLATCIQHEIDHINGVVFVDHISKLKRELILKKLKKAKKLGTIATEPQPVSS